MIRENNKKLNKFKNNLQLNGSLNTTKVKMQTTQQENRTNHRMATVIRDVSQTRTLG